MTGTPQRPVTMRKIWNKWKPKYRCMGRAELRLSYDKETYFILMFFVVVLTMCPAHIVHQHGLNRVKRTWICGYTNEKMPGGVRGPRRSMWPCVHVCLCDVWCTYKYIHCLYPTNVRKILFALTLISRTLCTAAEIIGAELIDRFVCNWLIKVVSNWRLLVTGRVCWQL